jgi:hypothetical protein
MNIVKADNTDLREILDLQYLAYQSEAALFGSKDIPPLKEKLSELEAEFEKGIILKMGYKKFKEEKITDELVFIYMEKE